MVTEKVAKYSKYFSIFLLGIVVASTIRVVSVYAHGGNASLIHSCVWDTTGVMRLVGESENCGTGETAKHWPSLVNIVCVSCQVQDLQNQMNTADLTDENLDLSVLTFSTLDNEDISGTSFVKAVLQNVQMNNSDISNADFTDANMRSMEIRDANAAGAVFANNHFRYTTFDGTDLSGATLTNIDWESTICPDGTNSDSNSDTCVGHLIP